MDRDEDLWDENGNPRYAQPPYLLPGFSMSQLRDFPPDHGSFTLTPVSNAQPQPLPKQSSTSRQPPLQMPRHRLSLYRGPIHEPSTMSQPQSYFQTFPQSHSMPQPQSYFETFPQSHSMPQLQSYFQTFPQSHSMSQPQSNFEAFLDELMSDNKSTDSPVSYPYLSNSPRIDDSPLTFDSPLQSQPQKEQRLSDLELEDMEATKMLILRSELLSRKCFLFDLSESLVYIQIAYLNAYAAVFFYVHHIQPKYSMNEIKDNYLQLIGAEKESLLEEEKSFDDRLKSRFTKLVQKSDIDLTKNPDVCEKLVSIFNARLIHIQNLDGGLEMLYLIRHLCSLEKKLIFIFGLGHGESQSVTTSCIKLLIPNKAELDEVDAMHFSTAMCFLSTVPVLIMQDSMLDAFGGLGDVHDSSGVIGKAQDVIFISKNASHLESAKMGGLIRVRITGWMKESVLPPADTMGYEIDTYDSLAEIMESELR